jgi:hypothetical protein
MMKSTKVKTNGQVGKKKPTKHKLKKASGENGEE